MVADSAAAGVLIRNYVRRESLHVPDVQQQHQWRNDQAAEASRGRDSVLVVAIKDMSRVLLVIMITTCILL